MRTLCLIMLVIGGLLLAATGATASGLPLANETQHFVDEQLNDVGPNCATGNLSQSDGVFSGIIHTLVMSDGSVRVRGSFRGTDTLDDFDPWPDGNPDATTSFVQTFQDLVFSSGKEVHTFTANGSLTVVATGEELRFHVIFQLVLDEDGIPKVEFVRITCD